MIVLQYVKIRTKPGKAEFRVKYKRKFPVENDAIEGKFIREHGTKWKKYRVLRRITPSRWFLDPW